jgi:Mg-chelatase subunit ChlD
MRSLFIVATSVLLSACMASGGGDVMNLRAGTGASAPADPTGDLQVEIQTPSPNLVLTNWESSIDVEGGASIFGGVRYLDLMFVLDTSKSLQRTDPRDYRSSGAVGLVESLPPRSDIQLGVVDFDLNGELILPLTTDRSAAVQALRGLNQTGRTDIAAGIRTALSELGKNARRDSSRVILLFTDGKSDADEARRAAEEARRQGVAVHTLLLGSSGKGETILREIADGTLASFIRVTDPAKLPEAFLNLRTTGIEHVTLRVNDSPPIATRLTGGTFLGQVPLSLGANEIVATATSLDGETREDSVTVTVSGPMSIAIDTPMRDTVVAYQDRAMTVEGTINSFEDLPEEVWPDPARWGVQSVVLRVNGSPPMVTTLEDGRFRGQVQLREGENHIEAMATSVDGRRAGDAVRVSMQAPGCAELEVQAVREGEPALSISDRAVELVFDASNSMWGQLNGEPKMGIAKEILTDALDWLPEDLELSLRVYGHRHKHELKNCTDSELLVPLGPGSRDRIREAIASFRPRGQTPIAYSLNEVASDFRAYSGERAVVLVTDGIESCGGDPVSAARRLYEEKGLTVHVIGFGLGSGPDEDTGSLRAIAEAGRGRFLTARSAAELRGALAVTVGTPFEVRSEDRVVARGALGSDEAIHLPAGEYVVRVESKPPREVPVRLERERGLTVVVERNQGTVSHWVQPREAGYTACSSAASATPSTFDPNRVPREVLQPPPAKYDFE